MNKSLLSLSIKELQDQIQYYDSINTEFSKAKSDILKTVLIRKQRKNGELFK